MQPHPGLSGSSRQPCCSPPLPVSHLEHCCSSSVLRDAPDVHLEPEQYGGAWCRSWTRPSPGALLPEDACCVKPLTCISYMVSWSMGVCRG